LSGLPAFVFPRVRAFVTSGPTVVAAMIGAVALWCMSAWFTMYIAKLLVTKPYRELTFNLFLGIPFGILIPLAAGFALYAISRIPPAPAPPEAPPPPDPVRMLGNTFAVFGVLWFLFAGSSSWTSGFNASGATTGHPELLHNAGLSLVLGALFVVVGLWLRRIAHATALS
jgi:hypothetical protein